MSEINALLDYYADRPYTFIPLDVKVRLAGDLFPDLLEEYASERASVRLVEEEKDHEIAKVEEERDAFEKERDDAVEHLRTLAEKIRALTTVLDGVGAGKPEDDERIADCVADLIDHMKEVGKDLDEDLWPKELSAPPPESKPKHEPRRETEPEKWARTNYPALSIAHVNTNSSAGEHRTPKLPTKARVCSVCGKTGHNKRTCALQ